MTTEPAAPSTTTRADMFVDRAEDPRSQTTVQGGEREVLAEYLTYQRQTFELKCADLTPEQLATRSVEPSTMSLLGLLRHLCEVELNWGRRVLAGEDVPLRYSGPGFRDGDFDGAVGEQHVVDEAWASWREEAAHTDEVVAAADLAQQVSLHDQQVSVREVVVHLIEEYARHNGHADLLRERIDGRIGQ